MLSFLAILAVALLVLAPFLAPFVSGVAVGIAIAASAAIVGAALSRTRNRASPTATVVAPAKEAPEATDWWMTTSTATRSFDDRIKGGNITTTATNAGVTAT